MDTIVETAAIKDDRIRAEFINLVKQGKIPEAGLGKHFTLENILRLSMMRPESLRRPSFRAF